MDFISNIDLKKINPNALLLYAEPEKVRQRIELGFEIIEIYKVDYEIKGCICVITNSNESQSIWTIVLFYQDASCTEILGVKLVKEMLSEIKKTGYYKVTNTFPADDLEQQKILIDCGFIPEGYFKGAILAKRDLITYSLF